MGVQESLIQKGNPKSRLETERRDKTKEMVKVEMMKNVKGDTWRKYERGK